MCKKSILSLNIYIFKAGRNDVTSDKMNFRLDIRQKFFLKKIRTARVCVALETVWTYCTLINIKLR